MFTCIAAESLVPFIRGNAYSLPGGWLWMNR